MRLSDLQNIKHFDKLSHMFGGLVIWLVGLITGYPIEAGGIAIAFYYGREQAQAERKLPVLRVSKSGLHQRSFKDELKSYFFVNWTKDAKWDVLVVVILILLLNILLEVYHNAT